MGRSLSATAGMSNSVGAETGVDFSVLGIGLGANAVITEVLKIKEPRKTWAFFANLIWSGGRGWEVTPRLAKHRVGGFRDYSVEELRRLLQSDDGLEFLVALMADEEPKWWWWAKQVMAVAAIKRRRAEDEQTILRLETSAPAEHGARRRIKGALDANRNIKAGIDRAETALGFQRPDVDSRNVDAPRSGAGTSHRSVAQARGRR